ncbi:MAG: hypothetical protein WCF57_18310 [Pyrinomonadaceae bacterium]
MRLRYSRHLLGDAVGFLFVSAAGRIYREFGLKLYWCFGMDWYLGEVMTKATGCGRIGVSLKAVRFILQ